MVRAKDWQQVSARTAAQAKRLMLTTDQLQAGISRALEQRDMSAVVRLHRRLQELDPKTARRLSDVLDLGRGF